MSVKHNIPEVRQDLDHLISGLSPVLREIARFADARISARAIGTYMRNASPVDRERPNETNRLRIISGRLSRAVATSFGAGESYGQRESRTTVTLTAAVLEYVREITVPYAGIHEHGGINTIPVTTRMRRFFWARFKETGDDKWKAFALTRKQHFVIRLRARPYIAPATEREEPAIAAHAEQRLSDYVISVIGA